MSYPTVFPRSNDYAPGTWKGLKLADGSRSASFCCPGCEQLGALVDHVIFDDGRVHPSVVCPTEGCDFHEYIQLEEWQDE